MHIQCKNCNYCEKVDKAFFAKLLGAVTASMGYWAWVSFFFCRNRFCNADLYRYYGGWWGYDGVF